MGEVQYALLEIEGLVVARRWSDDGIITGVSILGPEEKEYPLVMDHLGEELVNYCQTVVKAVIAVAPASSFDSDEEEMLVFNKKKQEKLLFWLYSFKLIEAFNY